MMPVDRESRAARDEVLSRLGRQWFAEAEQREAAETAKDRRLASPGRRRNHDDADNVVSDGLDCDDASSGDDGGE